MSTRHSDHDGSDIFWPGYVDAVTNLVLNLLFLLTIMTVAVFMFALELGRASKFVADKPPVAAAEAKIISKATTDPVIENIVLKLEIQRLNVELAKLVPQKVQSVKHEQPLQPVQPDGLVKTVVATANMPKPLHGLGKEPSGDSEIIVPFADEAIAFTPREHDQVLKSLQPVLARGKARIYVEVPVGFSEAKRMGYYRAMAVRNLLLEMGMAAENIDVLQGEEKNANASLVRVR